MNLKQKLRLVLILITVILFGVSILGYLLARTIGLGPSGQSVMTFGPLAAAILVFSVQFLSLDLQTNLLLMLVTAGLGILSIEGALTLLSPPAAEFKTDAQTQLDVVRSMRAKGAPATINVNASSFITAMNEKRVETDLLPLGGVGSSKVVLCNEVGEWVVFDSDSNGFNNPKELYGSEGLSIGVVGDSFAQGNCTTTEESIVGRIRERYPNSLNLGLAGTGPLVHLATFREYLEPLRPETVLWFFCESNDYANLNHEKSNAMLARYLEPDFKQGLIERQSELQEFVGAYAENHIREKALTGKKPQATPVLWQYRKHPLVKFLTLNQILGRLGFFPAGGGQNSGEIDADDYHKLSQILTLARDKVESWGGKMYFVYIVEKSHFSKLGSPPRHREHTLELVESLKIPVLDTLGPLGSHANALELYQGHFTPLGNSIVGDFIMDSLKLTETGSERPSENK